MILQNSYTAFGFFFVVSFIGISLVGWGVTTNNGIIVVLFGLALIAASLFSIRKTVPRSLINNSLMGGAIGVSIGALAGWLFKDNLDWMIGVIGSALGGAAAGAFLFVLPFTRLPFGLLIVNRETRGRFLSVVMGIGAISGMIFGLINWRETFEQIYEPIGGGMVSGWILGIISSSIIVQSRKNELV